MKRRYYILGGIVAVCVAVVVLWDWDWFIPIVDAQAGAALGRKVEIKHLHVKLGLRPIITADDVTIANPAGFDTDPPFAQIARLQVQADIPAYIHDRSLNIPLIALDHPAVELRQLDNGQANWTFTGTSGSKNDSGSASATPPLKIGDLRISDGRVHAVVPKMRSDFEVDIATREPQGAPAQLVADAKGTYAGQPITGQFVGGALLSLRDAQNPYPIDLKLANGPTHVSLVGTVQNPVAFAGADLKLQFAGPDLALLYPLTGVAIPPTPSYEVSGKLDYSKGSIRFDDINGRVGSSDLEGDLAVETGGVRPHVTANLRSRQVDLADLGGAVGSTPGRLSTPGQTPEQHQAVARAEASPQLIPNVPLNLPKLKAADVDLKYHGAKIEGRRVPLDTLTIVLTIRDGNVDLHPLAFGIGRGEMSGNIKLANEGNDLHANAAVDFRQIDLKRIMSAASGSTFSGFGAIGGHAALEGTGSSLAGLLDNGDGELKLFMDSGGDVSALLVDLAGLQFGDAVLSALGLPRHADINCMISDFALRRGIVETRTFLLDTSESNVIGSGDINLRNETLNLKLHTDAKHFTIGSLPAPIDISGPLKSPSIGPDAATLAARGGAAIGLGILLTPLAALIPTIQFGLGQDNKCAALLTTAQSKPATSTERGAKR